MLLLLIVLVACSEQEYKKDDVVATLNEKEIKIEDILWQTSLEENPEHRITAHLKLEVLIQEARELGITVLDEEIAQRKRDSQFDSNASEMYELNKQFYEEQASILGVSPEEYFEVWADQSFATGAYLEKYVSMLFGTTNDAENLEVRDKKMNEHMDDLFQRYKNEGKLIMK